MRLACKERVQLRLGSVAEGRMTEIMRQARRRDRAMVEALGATAVRKLRNDRQADLFNLEAMR
jgi:hypothetical protein